eukprot:1648682-Rhodomonas_salina.1
MCIRDRAWRAMKPTPPPLSSALLAPLGAELAPLGAELASVGAELTPLGAELAPVGGLSFTEEGGGPCPPLA